MCSRDDKPNSGLVEGAHRETNYPPVDPPRDHLSGAQNEAQGSKRKRRRASPTEKELFDVDAANNMHIDFGACAQAGEPVRLAFPYRANFNDHFETSSEALRDLLPVIESLRSLVRPSCPESFTIYDPYYCAGAVKEHWAQLGVPCVIHEKRDFYHDIEEGTVPSTFDMLVTNPPYSDDHIQRLMEFLIGSNKPWAFLVPDYVATKEWYRELIGSCFEANLVAYRGQNIFSGSGEGAGSVAVRRPHTTAPQAAALAHSRSAAAAAIPRMPLPPSSGPPSISAAAASLLQAVQASSSPVAPQRVVVGVEPFYIVPRVWYDFKHPLGAGHDKSHFKSMWFVWCGRRTNDVLRAVTCTFAARAAEGNQPSVVTGLASLREAQHVRAEGRKNPRQRAKERGM